jgi:hypothetical protein
MRQSTDRRTPRPVGPAAAALSKMLSRAYGQVEAPARDFVATRYEIGLSAADLSALVVSQTAGKAAAHA